MAKDKVCDDFGAKKKEFRAITEQGDLGLGADVLSESDQKIIAEQMSEE